MSYTQTLITVKAGAAILGLSPKTIYNRRGGTEKLKLLRFGRGVRLILQEVEALKASVIKTASGEMPHGKEAKTVLSGERALVLSAGV